VLVHVKTIPNTLVSLREHTSNEVNITHVLLPLQNYVRLVLELYSRYMRNRNQHWLGEKRNSDIKKYLYESSLGVDLLYLERGMT
jgi:hypothetical protein